MTGYLEEQFDLNDGSLVAVYDELPLWSSYFGAKLLDLIEYRKGLTALDIGCGTGFPLIELAQRLGQSSSVYGIDVWTPAYERIRLKLKKMNINNVMFLNQPAESLPFRDSSFDLVVSNNGINNVNDPGKVLSETFRVMKDKAQFLMSVNLPGTMNEFYSVFSRVLESHRLLKEIDKVREHIRSKRKTLDEHLDILKRNKFTIKDIAEDSFNMRFADGSAFLNHYFIKLAFLDSWKSIPGKELIQEIFAETELELNKIAEQNGHLKLTIPFVVINCYK